MPSIDFRVTGRVQGVFFRRHTITTAQQLGLRGWVRNDPDGAVVGQAGGSEDQITSFTTFLHQGPPAAVVEQVKINALHTPETDLPLPFALRKHS